MAVRSSRRCTGGRFLTKGDKQWFGGGADLTPYYPYREDVIHFQGRLALVRPEHLGRRPQPEETGGDKGINSV